MSLIVAHCQITGELGRGGTAEVHRATDTKLDRNVAIKVLPKSRADDHSRPAHFEREAKVLAALDHPRIRVIYGIEQSVETQAVITE